jgi:hypothetical protein
MRMSQSLAEFDSALEEEIELQRSVDMHRRRQAEVRSIRRHVEKTNRRGTMRFLLLVLILMGTAVGVTIAMFQTLYLVMG